MQRVRHREKLDAIVCQQFQAFTLEQAKAALEEANIAYGQVRTVADLIGHAALRTWPMPIGSNVIQMIAPPVQTEWDTGRFPPAPAIGANSDAIRNEFAGSS